MTGRVSPVVACLFGWGLLLGYLGEASAEVTIDGSSDQHIVVEARNATVQEIVSRISEGRDFTVERGDTAGEDRRITSRFEGPVSHVLDRVLEQENNVVIRDERSSRITRIVLYGPQRDKAQMPDGAAAAAAPAHRPNLVKVDFKPVASAPSAKTSSTNDPKRPRRQQVQRRPLHAQLQSAAQATR